MSNTFSIGELAREFDITIRSIRFYEDQGLITPERKGQTRVYNRRDRVRLKLILRGKRLGFTLAETGRLFELYDDDKSSTSQLNIIKGLISDKQAALKQQLNDIEVVMLELSALEKRCEAAHRTINANADTSQQTTINIKETK